MTQPEQAVGGDAVNTDSSSPIDPIDAIVEQFLSEDEEQGEQPADLAEAGEGESEELSVEDVAEDEADELPPIEAPVSWSADKKEEFKNLPRSIQETIATRETERERFVQSKAQEAAQSKAEAETAAMAQVAEFQRQTAERLDQYAKQLEVRKPDPSLIASDPELYALQVSAYDHYTAQREQAQREAEQHRQQAGAYEQELERREQEAFRQTLSEAFPEFLEPSNTELRERLGSTAKDLGYSAEQLTNANATDIIAMKTANGWREDSIKYRALMAKKMERVRDGKTLPPVARPGTAQTKSQISQKAVTASWERAKQTKSGDAYADYLSNIGVI